MKKMAIILITLIMMGTGLFSGCTQIPVEIKNNPPTASCTANPISGSTPLTVFFGGSGNDSDGNITSYYWDFGDGSTSNLQNPSHMFTNDGDFNVTFTVRDNKGSPGVDTLQIHVTQPTNQPPVASLSANRTGGTMPLAVSFTGSGNDTDGYITSYFWNFGDGSSSNQQSPSHTFTEEGSYKVTLTVTDDDGVADTDYLNIESFSVSHWTQNGINFICRNFGKNNCCVSSGLTWQEDGEPKNQTGGTGVIVAMLVTGLVNTITMVDPATGTFTRNDINKANGEFVTFDDAAILKYHDELSGDQWCYNP